MRFAKRMERFGTSIFTVLLEMKNEKLKRGEEVIDLSVGTPNIPPADHIIEALVEAAKDKTNYIYALKDTEELLEAVKVWYKRRYDVDVDPQKEVISLLGSQEGLAHIALTLADPGDVVLVPDPCYPIFGDGPVISGAKLHYMPLKKENNYLIDFEAIPEEVARAAKLMVVSYPNNPTTAIAPDWFYDKLIAFAKKYDIAVLHDNAYSELVFDCLDDTEESAERRENNENVSANHKEGCGSFLSHPGAKDVGVEFNSLSKTYGLAGARIGFCIGNAQMVEKLSVLKSNTDYGMFLPIQKAAVAAITGDQSCVETTRNAYRRRRDAFCEGMTSIGWPVDKCPATMFVWAKIPEGYQSSEDFVKTMLDRAGVIVTPGSAFGPLGEGYVRVALVQDEEVIRRAVEKVKESKILSI